MKVIREVAQAMRGTKKRSGMKTIWKKKKNQSQNLPWTCTDQADLQGSAQDCNAFKITQQRLMLPQPQPQPHDVTDSYMFASVEDDFGSLIWGTPQI